MRVHCGSAGLLHHAKLHNTRADLTISPDFRAVQNVVEPSGLQDWDTVNIHVNLFDGMVRELFFK